MERNREPRRASVVSSNGFNRRRYRTSLRDSPDEDMGMEMHESARLRERAKKDRDRDRERDLRERDLRERDLRERPNRVMNTLKRRRNERLTNNRADAVNDEETSEESVNDEEDDEDEDNNTATAAANHHSNHRDSGGGFGRSPNSNTNISGNNLLAGAVPHRLEHGKSYPPPNAASNKAGFRAPPVWRSGDEVINVSVPRKARSTSTKRSHDWFSSSSNNNSGGAVVGGGGGEQNLRQVSDSPARHGAVPTPNQPPTSPSSSNASLRKKLKHAGNNNIGLKLKPPSKPSSSNAEELEIEIAEVLYGLKTQAQGGPSSSSKKDDVNRSSNEAKSHHSSPPSNATPNNNNIIISGPNRSPLTVVAPKRKKPRQVPENLSFAVQISSIAAKEADQTPKTDTSSPSNVDKVPSEMEGSNVISPVQAVLPLEPKAQILVASESRDDDTSNLLSKEEILPTKEKGSAAVKTERVENEPSASATPTSKFSTAEAQKEDKYVIDLMAPPPQLRSSPERETVLDSSHASSADPNPALSAVNTELMPPMTSKENGEDGNEKIQEKKRGEAESSSSVKASDGNNVLRIDLQIDQEKTGREGNDGGVNTFGNKLPAMSAKAVREDHVPERHGQTTSSMLLPLPVASWPGAFPPMGYMAAAPLQGVVPSDGASVTPAHIPPPLFTQQPRPSRCATHCFLARNIYYDQQFAKMNPFWPGPAGSPLFGPRPSGLNVMPASDLTVKGLTAANPHEKPQNPSNASAPPPPPNNNVVKISPSQPSNNSDSSQRKQQQVLIQQQPLPPNNLMGPTFIFPLNQQQAALAARPGNAKPSASAAQPSSSPAPPMAAFNYPGVGPNEPQYLAILQNGGYPFPLPPGFRGPAGHPVPAAVFNGSFFPTSQMIPHHHHHHHSPSSLSQANSSSQKLQKAPNSQKLQQPSNVPPKAKQSAEGETNGDDRLPPAVNMYGQNFAVHPQNFALMTAPSPAANAAAYGSSNNNNQTEKRNAAHQQQQGFAMSFGQGIDVSSMVQNHHHPMFQNSPDMARHMMPGAHKKNARVSEDGKSSVGAGNDSSSAAASEDERRVKSQQSIAFSRTDFPDSARVSRASPAGVNAATAHSMQSHLHHHHHQQQQQIMQLKHHQQQQQLAAANRGGGGKGGPLAANNSSVFSDHFNSSSPPTTGAKFPVMQMSMSSGPTQSQAQSQPGQWKGSNVARTSASPQMAAQSPLGSSSSSSTFKGVLQQNSRSQQQSPAAHTQISFGGANHKPSSQGQGMSAPPPMMAAANSPTTSSMSKGASGNSPRTSVSASTTNNNSKASQGSSPNLSSTLQNPKNSPSSMMQSQKSPSILGNPSSKAAAAAAAAQANSQQQQQQQMMAKNAQQLFFSNPFAQAQPSPSNSATASVYYMNNQAKRAADKSQQQLMQGNASNNGMLSLSGNSSAAAAATTDPAKAIAAATKGVYGAAAPQFGPQPGGLLTGFPYAQPSVQGKPAEQKQIAGNENPRTWQQPEKK